MNRPDTRGRGGSAVREALCALALALGLGAGCAADRPGVAGSGADSGKSPATADRATAVKDAGGRATQPAVVPEGSLSPIPTAPAPETAAQQRQRLAALWQRIGLEFVSIPGGEFEMQTRGGVVDKHPERVAGFFLGRYEVTVGQFRSFVEATGYRTGAEEAGGCRQLQKAGYWEARGGATWRAPGFPQRDDQPVVCVSWRDVQAFCAWAGVRLPTEAEWEFAAGNGARWALFSWGNGAPAGKRSGNLAGEEVKGIFGWGGVGVLAGHDDGHQHTAPVGSYEPDGLGLFDMTGNALEWTSTPWRLSGTYALRGGSWQSVADNAQVASATAYYPKNKSDFIGFRVARDAP